MPEEVVEEVVEAKVEDTSGDRKLPMDERKFPDTHSDQLGELFASLAKAQKLMANGKKDAEGYNYNYMELDQLLDISRAPLADHGLSILQTHELIVRNRIPAVVTHTMLGHESGQWYRTSLELPIEPKKNLSKAQAIGVAATYARRYSVQALCKIASEKDTDGKAATN